MRALARYSSASRATRGWAAATAIGLTLGTVGTYLPWLESGSIRRDSYATGAIIDYVLALDPAVELLLRAWSGVSLLAAVCLVALAFGWFRTAAGLSGFFSFTAGTVVALLLVQASDTGGLVRIDPIGPMSTAVGSALALLGTVGLLVTRLRREKGSAPT